MDGGRKAWRRGEQKHGAQIKNMTNEHLLHNGVIKHVNDACADH